MKRFGLFILSAVAAAFATVFAFNVMDARAEEAPGAIITVGTMADTVRQLKLTEAYGYHDEIVYEDDVVSISFYFETVSESEWEKALSELSPEEIETLEKGLIEEYGLSLDDVHEMVRDGYFWSRTFTCRPWSTLIMV